MNKLMQMMMLSCKKAATLVEKQEEAGLSVMEKMKLHLHTSMCAACKLYAKQNRIIDSLLEKKFRSGPDNVNPIIENKELKEKIISRL